jgi:hypothetical protein
MLTEKGRLYLIDFGIARRFKRGQVKDTLPFGSPGYAAPEQYGRTQTTPRADIYSLGALLHQVLSGEDPTRTAFQFVSIREKNPAVPQELETLVMSMVALDASQRPERVEQIKETLQALDQQQSGQRGLAALPGLPAASAVPINFSAIGSSPHSASPPGFSASGSGPGGQIQLQQLAKHWQATAYYQPKHWPQQGSLAQAFSPHPSLIRKAKEEGRVSMLLGLATLITPLLLCTGNIGYLFPLSLWVFIIALILLPMLAIGFGHSARQRAKAMRGYAFDNTAANAGLIFGYGMIALYVGLLVLIFVVSVSGFNPFN